MKRLVVVLACVAVAFGASAAGSAPPREGPPDQIDHTNAAVGWDGTNFLVLWDEFDVTKKTEDTRGARVRPDGTVLDPDRLLIVSGRRTSPALAFDGTNYLVVWSEFASGDSDLYGERVTPDGVVLDPGGFTISTAPGNQSGAGLAFDGTNFLVV